MMNNITDKNFKEKLEKVILHTVESEYGKDENWEYDLNLINDVTELAEMVNDENIYVLQYCENKEELNKEIQNYIEEHGWILKDVEPNIEWDGPGFYIAWAWFFTADYRVVTAKECFRAELESFVDFDDRFEFFEIEIGK